MEDFFQADFSNVRVHVGDQPRTIGALAFTSGSTIHFAPGTYQPLHPSGQRLIARELAHVVQQRAGRVQNPLGTGLVVVQDPVLEAEAERMGWQAAAREKGDGHDAREAQNLNRVAHGFPVQDISMYAWTTGGKEKNIYRMARDKAAAVSKTGDLRRIETEVGTLHDLKKHRVPTIEVSNVAMFRTGNRVSPGFVTDWIENSVDSNADPVGFQLGLRRLRTDQRKTATRDLDRIQHYIEGHGGILDLQALLDTHSGHLRVLDPRGQILETAGSFTVLKQWREALQPLGGNA